MQYIDIVKDAANYTQLTRIGDTISPELQQRALSMIRVIFQEWDLEGFNRNKQIEITHNIGSNSQFTIGRDDADVDNEPIQGILSVTLEYGYEYNRYVATEVQDTEALSLRTRGYNSFPNLYQHIRGEPNSIIKFNTGGRTHVSHTVRVIYYPRFTPPTSLNDNFLHDYNLIRYLTVCLQHHLCMMYQLPMLGYMERERARHKGQLSREYRNVF